tara:strand:- start:202 stop:1599 length:1398 start_codon:yes stop_codon:yes gene_type:complete
MAGGKGGSTTSTVEVPQYIEDAARRNLERADLISQIGYVPYFGPDVAAFTPQQEAAFAGTQQLAGAFGTPTTMDMGVPAPQTFAGGVRGYSSAPMFEQAQFELGRRRPAQKAFIDSLFIDPFSGAFNPISTTPLDMGEVVDTTSTTAPVISTTPVTTTTGGGGGPTRVIADDFGNRGGTSFTTYGGSQDVANQAVVDAFADFGQQVSDAVATGGTVNVEDNPAFNAGIKAANENVVTTFRTKSGDTVRKTRGSLTQSDINSASAADQGRLAAESMLAAGIRNVGAGFAQDDPTTGFLGGLQDAYGYIAQGPQTILGDVFSPTTAQTQARLDAEIAARAAASENAAQRRENELNRAIAEVGGQELLDTGAQLAGDQIMALERQFGTLTTSEVVDQANLDQKSIPLGKGGKDQTRKVLDKAAQEGNLGAYVDSFMDKYGSNLNQFQQDTGISSAVMKDIEKIAAAKG